MMRALLRKELRQILPWAAVMLAFELGFLVLELAFQAPDEFVWATGTPIFDPTSAKFRCATLLGWSLMFAIAGFPREHDDQTLHFLFSLPVARVRLFLAKTLAAGAMLSAAVLLGEGSRWLVQLANPTSFGGHTFRFDWALTSLVSGLVVAWVELGYGLFLGIFRRFGLLLCAFAWTALELLEREWPRLRSLNPLELLHLEFYGTTPLLHWRLFGGHALAASCLALVSAAVWVGPTERFANAFAHALNSIWMKWLFGLSLMGALGLIGFLAAKKSEAEPARFGVPSEQDAPEARHESRYYAFRYRAPFRARVERLALRADQAFTRVTARLAAAASSDKIQVNLLKSSGRHAGSATWNAIRMDFSAAYDDENLLRTLTHETTHVIALRVSDRRLESEAQTLRFFDEGLAEQLAFEVAPDQSWLRGRWLLAALARSRTRFEFVDLLDFATFTRRFGEAAIYPLGLTWVRSLQDVCGELAPARLLATLATPQATLDRAGQALLQSTLQAIHCDLGAVNNRWSEELDRATREQEAAIERVPVLSGGVLRAVDEDVIVRAELSGKPFDGAVYHLNVRARPESAIEDQLTLSATPRSDGALEFEVPEDYVVNGKIQFQFAVGWLEERAFLEHFQEWRDSPVP